MRWEEESPIEGVRTEGDGPTARRMYPVAAIEELGVEDADEEQKNAISLMIRETARAATEIHRSAKVAIDAGVAALEGSDPRTVALLEELERMRKHVRTLESKSLLVWELLHSMHEARIAEQKAAAAREADGIMSVKRQELMADSFRLAWPGILHRLAPSKATEKSIIASAFAHMNETARAQLMGIVAGLPPAIQQSVGALLGEALEDEAKRVQEKETPRQLEANGAPPK